MFFKILLSEFKKARHSSSIWFSIIAASLVPFIMFLVYLLKWEHFIVPEDINPWARYITRAFQSTAPFLFPAYIIMLIAMNAQLEHKNNSWKKLYMLPVNKSYIYLSKLTFLSLLIISALLLFCILLVLAALLNGIIHPELGFTKYSPDFQLLFTHSGNLIIAVLGIISIQTFISMISRNMILPLASGIFLLIASAILVLGWKGSIYNPYAFPQIFVNETLGFMNPKETLGINTPKLFSILTFIIVTIPANIFFTNRQIKN